MKAQPEVQVPERSPDGQIPVNTNRAALVVGQPDPLTQTADGMGPMPEDQHSQQIDDSAEEAGATPAAKVVTRSGATRGRHVRQTPGADVSKTRHAHVIRSTKGD